jgi:hypothetical protein
MLGGDPKREHVDREGCDREEHSGYSAESYVEMNPERGRVVSAAGSITPFLETSPFVRSLIYSSLLLVSDAS